MQLPLKKKKRKRGSSRVRGTLCIGKAETKQLEGLTQIGLLHLNESRESLGCREHQLFRLKSILPDLVTLNFKCNFYYSRNDLYYSCQFATVLLCQLVRPSLNHSGTGRGEGKDLSSISLPPFPLTPRRICLWIRNVYYPDYQDFSKHVIEVRNINLLPWVKNYYYLPGERCTPNPTVTSDWWYHRLWSTLKREREELRKNSWIVYGPSPDLQKSKGERLGYFVVLIMWVKCLHL